MSNQHQYVAIMAGGIGSRFLPARREALPKQFLDILNIGETLLQSTFNRFAGFIPPDHIFIVTAAQYVPLVQEQLPNLKPEQIITEPMRRNTAPCILLAANKIAAIDPDATFIVAPSDHHITDIPIFESALNKALDFASQTNTLLTLGITPTRPHTGYGYIQFDEELSKNGIYKVKTFVEKPPHDLAVSFLRFGDFLWNSGIFIWSAKSILQAFEKIQPDMYHIFNEGKHLYNTPHEKDFIESAYKATIGESIDYAIMEHADNVYVIPANFGWSDLGNWSSLWEKHDKDYYGNAASGKNIMVYDSENCMVRVKGNKLVIIQGLCDYCIIDTDDVLLICRLEDEQKIREINKEVIEKFGKRFS